MASTNKTPNLQLSQYLGSDKFQRVDYNGDMLKIDAAVKAAQDAVDNLTLDNVPDGETRKLGDATSISGVPVDLTGLTEGQTLVFDGEQFAPADGGTGDASSIDGLPVNLSGMTDGQTIVLQDGELVPGSGGGTDDIWLPSVSEDGDISWTRSSSTTPPTTRNIMGPRGNDGADGKDGADGQDGITPHIDPVTKHWMIGDTDTGIVAEGKDGADGQNGADGKDGADGITPHIGENGNWYIGDTDTEIPARGPMGEKGDTGSPGKDGAKWYTSATAPTGANEGDYWLSTATATLGNVYRYDGSDWVLQTNIKGQDGTGSGDMLWTVWRAIYDPTASGKVIEAVSADTVPWSGVSDKPETYTPSAHTHDWPEIGNVPEASTSSPGIVQLSSAVDSTAEDKAATSKAVKTAYDAAVIKGYPEITQSNGTATINPNTVNIFGDSIASISLTLASPVSGYSNEYVAIIDATTDAPSFTITSPSGVSWGDAGAPTIETGKVYLIVITVVAGAYWGFWEAR